MTARTRLALLTASATVAFLALAAPAAAASPWWHLTSTARPTVLPSEAGKKGEIILTAANLGNANLSAATEPIQIADTLPPHLHALTIEALSGKGGEQFGSTDGTLTCSISKLICTFAGTYKNGHGETVPKALPPFDQIEVRIGVKVEPGAATGELNKATVSGGNAPSASIASPIAFSGEPTPFGLSDYELAPEEEGGALTSHAGSHDYQLTTTLVVNQRASVRNGEEGYEAFPSALVKDLGVKLPPGLIGNPSPFPRCPLQQFFKDPSGNETFCPPQTVLGVAMVTINEPALGGVVTLVAPIVNLQPAFGEPARFGFLLPVTPVFIDTAVRSSKGPHGEEADYGVTAASLNTSQIASFLSAELTFWGTPGDPSHDATRGSGCLQKARSELNTIACAPLEANQPPPFQSLPTSCSGPMLSSVEIDSWADPLNLFEVPSSQPMAALDGCNQVPFAPTISSSPTANAATSPTGLDFAINFNDEGLQNPEGTIESQIKKAVVTLPQGFTTNPSVAEGLKACSLGEYEAASLQSGSGCTEESKVGDVEVESPLVAQKVLGSLYVAKQGENPYGNLLTLYLVARNTEIGVLIKQALKVTPNPLTGQLTTEVDNVPQLPFSHFRLSFRQGQRSPLVTPPACGPYTVNADLYPYSNPTEPTRRESSFLITQGPEGQGCPSGGVPPFHPGLEAGTINNAAGTYSPFYTHMSRKDSEQEITHFSIKLPPGVIGKLAGVSTCSDAQIAAAKAREHEGGGQEELSSPSCPANSEVGHSLVGSGVGNVLAYAPGKLYLAGPYHGSNISLVSITAAKVGPFDLGTVVVRFALRIDPETAEVFVDSQGSDPIPHIVDGIPVHLRDIRAYVDRPNFTLNPTSCAKKSTASTVLGSGLNFASEADDQPVTVTSPFQAADCASLGFAPKLGLSLKGGTRRGAVPAFKAVLTYPKGSYANIAKSVVTLPHSEFLKQEHIRTICTRTQFKEGTVPGEKCPAASIYGRAEAITPLLSEPLRGPVYLRSSSHPLPDLVAALHNNQVDFALDGRIDSVEGGRIRNTFETVPDAPVSKFVLEMQGGKKGLLVNSTNLCDATHRAISEFTGQNGKLFDTKPVLSAKCGGKGKKGKKGRHAV